MKFKYRLQKVLEYRKTLEEIAQKEFQEVQNQLQQEINRLQEMKTSLQLANQQRGEIQDNVPHFVPATLKQIHEYIVLQTKVIEKQMRLIESIEKVVEEKRLILVEKVKDTKVLSRLKEKKLEEHVSEMKKKEQSESDELSVLRYESDI